MFLRIKKNMVKVLNMPINKKGYMKFVYLRKRDEANTLVPKSTKNSLSDLALILNFCLKLLFLL